MSDLDKDFTQGSITRKMLKFMIPILGALVLQAMYGAVDIMVIGKFGSASGISGVSTGSAIVNLIVFTIASFSMSVTVLIGQYIGQKNEHKIGAVVGGAISLFAVFAVVVMVIMLTLAGPLARLMQAPDDAFNQTVQYVQICGGGIVFIIAYNFISSIFRGLGDSKLPLVFVAIACVVNIVGDLLFIAVFKWDVAGAAIATVLAQAVSVGLSILIIRKKKLPFTLKKSDIRFNSEVKNIIKIGYPIALQDMLTNLSFLALCAFINRLGLDASAGYGVAFKITSFVLLVPSSLMQSMATFVSQNVGAKKEDRAKKCMKTGMLIGSCIGVVVALLVFFFGEQISSLFANEEATIIAAGDYLKGFSAEAIVTCILFSFIGYYNGHGQTLFVMIQGISQTFLVRLPLSYIMSIQDNASLMNIGLAAPAATIFGITLNVIYFIYYNKHTLQKQMEVE